ncbi:MAG: thioredoxin TrxC [Sulfurimonas sp.]|jgi:thioredoxin 2|nr:thioredoxin TrxC [Sulfurimonadaceae bacterium]
MRVVCPHCLGVNNVPYKESYTKANCGRCKNSLLENKIIELSGDNFDEVVVNSDLPVVIDFWAPWCGPCRSMAPAFEKSAKSFGLKALYAKVNTEEYPQLSARFGIRGIPTIIIFKDSKEVHRVSGALDELSISKLVKGLL